MCSLYVQIQFPYVMMEKKSIANLITNIPTCIRFGKFLKLVFVFIGKSRFSRDSSVCKLSELVFLLRLVPAE